MNNLSRFLLLAIYVTSVLFVTTIGAKDYIYRTDEKAEKKRNLEEVMAENDEINKGTAVAWNEELNTSGDAAWNDVVNVRDSVSENDMANAGDSVSENDMANVEDAEPDDDGLKGNRPHIGYLEHFNELRAACEQFMTEFDRPGDSYEKTLRINRADKKCISENEYDFSKIKIACLGDSVTEASNLEEEENYKQYAYPSVLKELLGAKEVYNLGIGGSSIGRYWLEPFVERYTDIPNDTDIIVVMGGYNDGFSASIEEFGSLEARAYNTFCGDLDELMRGFKENYPNATVFFATPMSTALHGALMSQNAELLPQQDYVQAIKTLSEEYGFEFVDLYNTGFLDSYDENIVKEFIPDTTHGNHAGYRMLAERFASEIIEYYSSRL